MIANIWSVGGTPYFNKEPKTIMLRVISVPVSLGSDRGFKIVSENPNGPSTQ